MGLGFIRSLSWHRAVLLGTFLTALTTLVSLALGLPAPAAAQQVQTIVMAERGAMWVFEPNQISVPAGQVRLTFQNTGIREHNFVITIAGATQRTPDFRGGQTAEHTFTFNQPGTYEAICDLPTHAQRGMRMTVNVTGTASGSGAATPAGSGAPGSTTGAGATTGSIGAPAVSANAVLQASLILHVLSAITWLGLVLYHAVVVAVPFLTPAQRGALLFWPRWIVLATIPIISVTGIYQTIYNPFGTIDSIHALEELKNTTTYGFALFLKHGFVFASWGLSLVVTFWFAPKLVAFAEDIRPEATSPSRLPTLMTWANVAACGALLICVAVMVYQLH